MNQPNNEVIYEVGFKFLSWEAFDHPELENFVSLQELEESCWAEQILVPFDRKKRVLYITHRWPHGRWLEWHQRNWLHIRQRTGKLSKRFDGFFYYPLCMYHSFADRAIRIRITSEQNQSNERKKACLSLLIQRCYVMVVNPIEEYGNRFWMLWELCCAIINRRLVINKYAMELLKDIGPNPTFDKVFNKLKRAEGADENERIVLYGQLESFFRKSAKYALILVDDLLEKDSWKTIRPFPLALEHVDPNKVLMVSHRWDTRADPDPEGWKLKKIQEHVKKQRGRYNYVFFDWLCIDQIKGVVDGLMNINELYANSPCLCLCDDEYFGRSWCLFEYSVNLFNSGSPVMIGKHDHPIVEWMETARLIQQMGYIHVIDDQFACGKENDASSLELPLDQLHLKWQLRILLDSSEITNTGDKVIILNLLDKLIPGVP